MICVLQRVSSASVTVDGKVTGEIGQGWLCLAGFEKDEQTELYPKKIEKILKLRGFNDEAGKMNRSLLDVQGGLLIVSQFTLLADLKKGNRPGFSRSADPKDAEIFYNKFVKEALKLYKDVRTGIFGADMKVRLVNDGPVTFIA